MTVISPEITSQFLGYIVADPRSPSLGSSVKDYAAHHPVASVSRAFRSIYLNQPYSASTQGRETIHLHKHWSSMRISWLQISLPLPLAIFSVDDPGIWSLLKIHNRLHGRITPEVRKCLKVRTHKKKLFPWSPLGLEKVG
ncbi:hypothetical protein WAI453_012673 [Rhynchosporium graminicola]